MTRVLFVDDEPIVLRSLGRTLRARKVTWEARFVESSTEALEVLSREPFDIVIADLRIPDLDGVELLTEVRRAYPWIARLVLSGQVGTDDCLRAMRVAHQCFAKPCDVAQLQHVVANIEWTHTLVDDGDLARRAAELTCLPSAPHVHAEVCKAIARNAGLAEIAHIIDGDVALVAKLFQVVSGASLAQGGHVTSVPRALSVLGTEVVRGLLPHANVFRAFEGADAMRIEKLSRHATLVAHIARELAPRDLAGDAFVAGMLHDIGKLVLMALDRPERRPQDHARAGAFLLGLWGVAQPIVEAIAHQHEPGVVPNPRAQLVDTLHLAAIVAGELTQQPDEPVDVISLECLARNAPAVLERARCVANQFWEQSV